MSFESNWREFLVEHKELNYANVPTTDEDYFVNSRELLHEDLKQMEDEGSIVFRFYPPQDKGALLNYDENRRIPRYYDMRFQAYAHYLGQQGKTLNKAERWVGETLHVEVSIR